MSTLKAFVGHSFTEDDEDVVREILEYLNQIQGMGIGFRWEHAKPAEPKVLAEKVLALIEDKNLFIGICTKKERVTSDENLKSKILCPSSLCAKKEDLDWKTSDWIIQEIGLAIGKNMDVILLLEEGLRAPGGLQGNLEYIQFSRNAPEKSFGRILQMIRALLPHAKSVEEAVAGIPKTAEEAEQKEEGDEWLHPKPDWKRRNYEYALMRTVDMKDAEGEQKIFDAYLNAENGKKESNIDSWYAAKEYFHILWAKDGSLSRLEKLAKSKPENSEVQRYLARSYQQFDENEKAAHTFLKAAANEKDKKKEIQQTGEAAKAYAKGNNKAELNKLVKELKEKSKSVEDGEIQLLEILKEIADINNDKTLSLAYTERLLDLKPDDHDSRFKLAYGHSEEDRRKLSLFHYLKIPCQHRSSITWNNLGVSYAGLDVDGKSVEAYRRSEDMDETLAMDNIARKLLDAGFFKEAQEQCDKAKTYDEYNKNIDDTSYRLKKRKEEEESKTTELLDEAKPIHEFYVKYGRAAAKEEVKSFKGKWEDSRCQLNLEVTNGKLNACGTYEVQNFGLLLSALPGAQEKRKMQVYYEGQITGHAVRGTIQFIEPGKEKKMRTVLTEDDDIKSVLMVISDDLTKINVYQESASYDSQRFQAIKKLQDED